jgi:hypothetical protein
MMSDIEVALSLVLYKYHIRPHMPEDDDER